MLLATQITNKLPAYNRNKKFITDLHEPVNEKYSISVQPLIPEDPF
jgi:hypothetical protein